MLLVEWNTRDVVPIHYSELFDVSKVGEYREELFVVCCVGLTYNFVGVDWEMSYFQWLHSFLYRLKYFASLLLFKQRGIEVDSTKRVEWFDDRWACGESISIYHAT